MEILKVLQTAPDSVSLEPQHLLVWFPCFVEFKLGWDLTQEVSYVWDFIG